MSEDRIEGFIPKTGMFNVLRQYTEVDETCPRFNFFAFVGAMGSIIKRNVYFQRASKTTFPTTYPNPWIILVAPQGIGHKSSALSLARNFLKKLPKELQPKMLASKLTPEALVRALASQMITEHEEGKVNNRVIKILKKPAQGLLYSSEFGVLLGREKYNQGMIALMTDLYDCPDEWNSETIMHGDQKMYDVCISVMGASTPDWMQSMLPSDAFKGGFMSRLILIGYPENWYIRIADPPAPDEQLEKKLYEYIFEIAKKRGEMKWTKDAKGFFESWYNNMSSPEPGVKASYLERKQDHLIKIAMIIHLSFLKDLILTKESLEYSLRILNSIEPETLKMIDYISVEPRMRGVQRILEVVAGKKLITESDLLDQTWKYLIRPSEFDDIVQLLLRSKKIVFVPGEEVRYKLKEEK